MTKRKKLLVDSNMNKPLEIKSFIIKALPMKVVQIKKRWVIRRNLSTMKKSMKKAI